MSKKQNQTKSFTAALEQIAKLLRQEVKVNEKKLKKRTLSFPKRTPSKIASLPMEKPQNKRRAG